MKTFRVYEYVDGDLKIFVDGQEIGLIPFKNRDLPLPQQIVAIERVMKTTLTDDERQALADELAFPRRW